MYQELDPTCVRCGLQRSTGAPDPCLGRLENVTEACCGHGEKDGYLLMDNRPDSIDRPDYTGRWRIRFPKEVEPSEILATHAAINAIWSLRKPS